MRRIARRQRRSGWTIAAAMIPGAGWVEASIGSLAVARDGRQHRKPPDDAKACGPLLVVERDACGRHGAYLLLNSTTEEHEAQTKNRVFILQDVTAAFPLMIFKTARGPWPVHRRRHSAAHAAPRIHRARALNHSGPAALCAVCRGLPGTDVVSHDVPWSSSCGLRCDPPRASVASMFVDRC